MKNILIITIAAVLVVGCGPSAPDISIHEAAEEGNIEAVKQHIAAGTDVNAKDEERSELGELRGWTPLFFAARNGSDELAELLIDKGADVNAKDKDGWTPLHLANYKEIAELLIDKGADINAKTKDTRATPLDWANGKEIADLLRKHGGKTGEELKAEGK